MSDLITPAEIAASLRHSGNLTANEAARLEQRIIAWANAQKAADHERGIRDAYAEAYAAIANIRRATERHGAQMALYAIRKLLPKTSEDYQRGFADGTSLAEFAAPVAQKSYQSSRQRYPRKRRSRRDGK